MKHSLCVVESFLTDAHRAKIEETAARCDCTVQYYATPEEADVSQCEILYSHFPQLVPQAKNLRWYCCSYAGVDPYITEEGKRLFCHPDCLLTNSSGAYGTAISEHMVMVTVMLLRRMPEYAAIVRARQWTNNLPVRSIRGSRVTVLGTGDIGSSYAHRIRAMYPASLSGVSRSGRAVPDFDRVVDVAHLDELLPETDILAVCLPATGDTVGLLSRERLALLPETAILINVGRGSVLDQEALVEALRAGRLSGAALDVMTPEPLPQDHPLWSMENVLLTPHVSGNMTVGYTCDRDVEMFCDDLERYGAGKPLTHLVDRTLGY
ncbi:MAG: D-2-hydroxyacid dehydrogenase [Oscillospiraceae bacterium]